MIDLALVRRLLPPELVRFCRTKEVLEALAAISDPAQVDRLRGFLRPDENDARARERALFAAMALATVGDAAGLEVLRNSGDYFVTNSGVETGLVNAALVLLGDPMPPGRMINDTMIRELSRALYQ
jgi:hypothetical protein